MSIKTASVLVLIASFGAAGCGVVPGLGSSDYSRGQARTEQSVRYGVVENVREVTLEGTRSGVGTVAGGVVGGIAGSKIGEGRGAAVGAVAGAVLGGIAGTTAEQQLTKQKGVEITVQLESGKSIAVTQAADERFNVGDRVRVLAGGGTTRVTH